MISGSRDLNHCLSLAQDPLGRGMGRLSFTSSVEDSGAKSSVWEEAGSIIPLGVSQTPAALPAFPWASLLFSGCHLHLAPPSPTSRSMFTFSSCEHPDPPGALSGFACPGRLCSEPNDEGEVRSLHLSSSLSPWPETSGFCPLLPQSSGAGGLRALAPLKLLFMTW